MMLKKSALSSMTFLLTYAIIYVKRRIFHLNFLSICCRFPFIACEIFTCEIDVILRTLVEDEQVGISSYPFEVFVQNISGCS
jgi:hypothetical protein